MASRAPVLASPRSAERLAARLAAEATLEVSSLDYAEFETARVHLRPGQRVYVSHLPGQTWRRSIDVCSGLSTAGFAAVPHIPVRALAGENELDGVLRAVRDAGVDELLLISGDYPQARGAFSSVLQVLRTGALHARGFQRVSLAGHPEGHPRVAWNEICQAQVDKWRLAAGMGLQVTFVTQFFFAAEPYVHWARFLRSSGVEARLVAGVAGPTGIGRLVKLARHCGVGSSLGMLTSRPASMLKLFVDHSPDGLLLDLAAEKLKQDGLLDGLHLFSLGGFARTAAWLRQFHRDRAG